MATGEAAFDAESARRAAAAIAEDASHIPALFEAQEDDPKSEALPAIWEEFSEFTEMSDELAVIALGLSTSIETQADVQQAVMALGQACRACHQAYRE